MPHFSSLALPLSLGQRVSAFKCEAFYASLRLIWEASDVIEGVRIATEIWDKALVCLASYHLNSRPDEIDKAISLFGEACDSSHHKELLSHITLDHCEALLTRFEDKGEDIDVDTAIKLVESQVSGPWVVRTNTIRAYRLLGKGLILKAERRPASSAIILERALGYLTSCKNITNGNNTDEAILCSVDYAWALKVHYASKGNPKDLYAALSALEEALNHASPGHHLRERVLSAFSFILFSRHGYLEGTADLDHAVTYVTEALALAPRGYRQHPILLNLLGCLLCTRYRSNADTDLLDRALRNFQKAEEHLNSARVLRYIVRGNYFEMLFLRYKAQSRLPDLESAINGTQDLLIDMPLDHVSRANYVTTLAEALERRFSDFGEQSSLNKAFDLRQEGLQKALPDERYYCLRNLSQLYYARHCAYGQQTDLDEAVRLIQEAISCCPYPMFKGRLHSFLGDFLTARFSLLKHKDDIDNAISSLSVALECAHDKASSHSAPYRSSLAHAFLQRFLFEGAPDDLTSAITEAAIAIAPLSDKDSCLPSGLFVLGRAYECKFSTQHALEDIQTAIDAYQRAADLTDEGRSKRATYLTRLASAQYALSSLLDAQDIFQLAVQNLSKASQDGFSSVTDRLEASALLATIAHEKGLLKEALESYQLSMDFLSQVPWVRIDNKSRLQWLLGKSPDYLCQAAAACAVALGQPELAVEWLEQRSTIWNTSQDLRVDLSTLRHAHPAQAQEFQEISAALDLWAFRGEVPIGLDAKGDRIEAQDDVRTYRARADRRQKLIDLIRADPKFKDFLRPFRFAELCKAASGGIIVILNVSAFRSDALIVAEDKHVHTLPLPRLNVEKAEGLADQLNQAIRSEGCIQNGERLLADVLRSLWDLLGAPIWDVIRTLNLGTTPHVWWCPTGPLSSLPIHACSPLDCVTRGMDDLVISSYVPTLSSLLRSKPLCAPNRAAPRFGQLAIGLNKFPYAVSVDGTSHMFGELPYVIKELDYLKELPWSEVMTVLKGSEATLLHVVENLPIRSWLHVATHGVSQSWSDAPLQIELLLHDEPLSLSVVAQSHLSQVEFAYLSTCCSASAHVRLPDEALHMAGAFLSAGYRGVVATMWSVVDEDGPRVAKVFYDHFARLDADPDVTQAAHALHIATLALRDTNVGLLCWVPFVHFGV